MDAGAFSATHACHLSSSSSLSNISRRHSSGSVANLPNSALNSFSPRKITSPSSFCNASMRTTIKRSGTEISESYLEELDDFREHSIMNLSPLNGRYAQKVKNLRPFFSPYGLIRFRVMVQVKWLIKISEINEIEEAANLSDSAWSSLEEIVDSFSMKDALVVKTIEEKGNCDVKAVEHFLKQKCRPFPEVSKVLEFFHFTCMPGDMNDLAYALSLKEALNSVIFPKMVELTKAISSMAKENAHIPMLSRTHGQPASPTTLGKEMSIFVVRLCRLGEVFSKLQILGKFTRAEVVGNYNADKAAYPNINWPGIAEEFVTSLGLKFNALMTQAMPHCYIASLCHAILEFNNILLDFDRDIWSYISLGYFKQTTKSTEVGSSTMPHKVNPIDFENSEGNLSMAKVALSHVAMKLPISRTKRSLSDSTIMRKIGDGLSYSLLAYLSALQGIQKLQVNESRINEDLEHAWEVLAEAIQIVMRRYGIPEPYEKLKDFTRGKAICKEDITDFIKDLDLPKDAKSELLELTPFSYIGKAEALAKSVDLATDLLNGFRIQ